jgi:hypothetical protein
VEQKKITWPSFFIGKSRDGLSTIWCVGAWPTVYVIDHQGIIRYFGNGEGMEQVVDACMRLLLMQW